MKIEMTSVRRPPSTFRVGKAGYVQMKVRDTNSGSTFGVRLEDGTITSVMPAKECIPVECKVVAIET